MKPFLNLADATEQAIKDSREPNAGRVFVVETHSEDFPFGVAPNTFDYAASYYHGTGNYRGKKMRFTILGTYINGDIMAGTPEAFEANNKAKERKQPSTATYFEVKTGPSSKLVHKGKHYWDTAEEAITAATEFKANPAKGFPTMKEEHIAYWKGQTYTIKKITKTVEVIKEI